MLTKPLLTTCVLAACPSLAGAQVVVMLGAQDYPDGWFIGATDTYNALQDDEPALHRVDGDDRHRGDVFDQTWAFTFEAPKHRIGGASITLGLADHDSAAPGDQVASFTIDGFDLSTELNALLESRGGTQAEVNVYELALAPSILGTLADGLVTVALTLAGPGLGTEGTLPGNGAALDFTTLTIAPAPASACMFALGGLTACRRRR